MPGWFRRMMLYMMSTAAFAVVLRAYRSHVIRTILLIDSLPSVDHRPTVP
jgi:hypothetical protein